MSQSMSVLQQHILNLQSTLLRQCSGPPGDVSEAMVAEITSALSNEDFLRLPCDIQFSFLDTVLSLYWKTFDRSALSQAAAVQAIFLAYLKDGRIPLHRLLKTYDLLYFLYWCCAVSIEQQRGFDTGVVIPFSRYLKEYCSSANITPGPGLSARTAVRADAQHRTRLCYMSEFLYRGQGNAHALVVEGFFSSLVTHCADAYEFFLYGWRYKEADLVEKIKALGVTVRCFDLREYSEAELLRLRNSFFSDHIDVVITDMNSAVPHFLFESRIAPVQVFYQLGMPFWGLQNLEAIFQVWHVPPDTLGFAADRCYAVSAPYYGGNVNPPIDRALVQNERGRFPKSERVIGFYGRLVKVTPGYLDILMRILRRHADTIAVLGGTGNANLILNFIKEHQLEERLFVVNEFVDGHVWGHFLDIFLDTFPLGGGYSCREVMAKGKPVVHMRNDEMPNVSALWDPQLQARHADEYVALVSRLLSDASSYHLASERAIEIQRQQADTRQFASTFHAALREVERKAVFNARRQAGTPPPDVNGRVPLAPASPQRRDWPPEAFWQVQQADQSVIQGDLAAARDSMQRALALVPDDQELIIAYGNILLHLNETEAARREFVKATALAPHHAPAHLGLGTALLLLGRTEAAEAAVHQALALAPNEGDAHKLLGRLYLESGRYGGALGAYEAARRQCPDDVEVLMALGRCYVETHDVESARAVYAGVLAIQPDHPIARENLEALDGRADHTAPKRGAGPLVSRSGEGTLNGEKALPVGRNTATTSHPLISVVTPSYNCAKYIRACIESVLGQNYSHFEHIVIDGASRDGTVEILKQYRHLKWVSEPDKGESEALNKALRMASGDIIGWLNADDWYAEGAFERVAGEMNPSGGRHVVYGHTNMVDERGTILWVKKSRPFMTLGLLLRWWMHRQQVHQPSLFYSRALIEDVGSFNETLQYSIDLEYWLRSIEKYPFHCVDQILANARLRTNSKSIGQSADTVPAQIESHWSVIFPYLTRLTSSEEIEYWKDYYVFRFFDFLEHPQYVDTVLPPQRQEALVGLSLALRHVERFEGAAFHLYSQVARYPGPRDPRAGTGEQGERLREAIEAFEQAIGAGRETSIAIKERLRRVGDEARAAPEGRQEGSATTAPSPGDQSVRQMNSVASILPLTRESGVVPRRRRIVIDGVMFQLQAKRPLGISRIWRNLIPELVAALPDHVVVVLRRSGYPVGIAGVTEREIPPYRLGPSSVLDADDAMLAQVCAEEGADVFLSTYYTRAPGVRNVLMAYDLIPEVMGFDLSQPEWLSKQRAIAIADAFIAISRSTRDDLIRFHCIPADRITVAQCGVSSGFRPVEQQQIEQFSRSHDIRLPYFVLAGNRGLYKNCGSFFRAFASLPERRRLGILAFGGEQHLLPEEVPLAQGLNVIGVPWLPDDELAAAYSGALALVYPSRYEGFGLPVLEAMACGCPVITARNSSLPEVGGEAVLYADPDSPDEISAALRETLKPDVRTRLAARGIDRARRFTWRGMAQGVARAIVATEASAVVTLATRPAPLVSAIVSVYNSERFIRGCLDDLERQTIADRLEIVVVNSGSAQNEDPIIREYMERYDNIVYIKTEQRETVYGAWNRGIKAARGRYITNANTDDRHRTDALEVLARTLDERPDITVVYADCLITRTENETFETAHPTGMFRWPDYDRLALFNRCFIGPQPMWRREVHDEYGYFDESFVSAGDYECWLRISKTRSFLHVKDTLGLYLESPMSIEHADAERAQREALQARERHRASLGVDPPPETLLWPEAVVGYVRQADDHFLRGDLVAAREALNQALAIVPDDRQLILALGNIVLRLGDIEAARREFVKATILYPNHAPAHLNLAAVLLMLGRTGEAECSVRRALTLSPTDVDALKLLGRLCLESRRYAEGVQAYADALRQSPNDLEALLMLAKCACETGDRESARLMYERVLKINPGNAVADESLAILNREAIQAASATTADQRDSRPPGQEQQPIVSVILPTYDRPEMLQDALASLVAQTFREFEVIVINDGGVDVQPVLDAFRGHLTIQYIRHPTNRERAAARNSGLRMAQGRYIAYLDDDDRLYADHLETLVTFLQHSDYKVAYTDAYMATQEKENGKYVVKRKDLTYSQDFDADLILVGNFVPILCVMHERACVEEVGFFDETLVTHEDWDLWIRMSRKHRFAHVRKVTAEFTHRSDGTRSSSGLRADFLRTRELMYQRYREHTKGKPHLIEAQKRAFRVDLLAAVRDLNVLGQSHCAQGDLIGAEKAFRQAIALAPRDPGSLLNLGKLYADMKRFEEAVSYLDVATRIDPADAEAWVRLALVAQQRGDQDAFRRACQRAFVLKPTHPKLQVMMKEGGIADLDEQRAHASPVPSGPSDRHASSNRGAGSTSENVVSIVIVTYNSAPTIRACLESVFQWAQPPAELMAVDNASTDGTRAILAEYAGRISTILNSENAGFSRACNQGIRASVGEYVVLLNPDTVVTPAWLDRMKAHFGPGVGAVGPVSDYVAGLQKVQLYLPQRRPASIGITELASLLGRMNGGKARETKLLTGFCMMVPRKVFDEVGLLDENLFLGNDDLDLSWRLRQRGYRLLVATDTFIHHEGQVSFKSEPSAKTTRLVQESTDRLYAKLAAHYGEGNVPDPMELWGINWFKPTTARFRTMAVAVKQTLTSIIVLTYNGLDHTRKCLASIEAHTPEPHELIIVDNGSADATPKYLRDYMAAHESVRVIANDDNRGFAAGNNQGLALARGDYVLLLNNDTVVTEGWLERMLSVFERHPEVGIVGPMSNHVIGPQLVSGAAYGTPAEMEAFAAQWAAEHAGQSVPIMRVVGFCLLARREVVDQIGGLDEQFGSGNFEDDDFCIRAALFGFRARVAQDVFIHHTGGQTFKALGIDYRESVLRNWELFKAKWGIPAETSYEQGYRCPDRLPEHLSGYCPLPDVRVDHTPGAGERWWQEVLPEARKSRPGPSGDGPLSAILAANGQGLAALWSSLVQHTHRPLAVSLVGSDGHGAPAGSEVPPQCPDGWHIETSDQSAVQRLNGALQSPCDAPVVLLSGDLVLTPGWLKRLLAALDRDREIAVVGPTSNYGASPERVKAHYKGTGKALRQFALRQAHRHAGRQVDASSLSGFCLLFDRAACRRIGPLRDDLDLSAALHDYFARLKQAGYRLAVALDVYVHRDQVWPDEGVLGFLEKPCQMTQLSEVVAKALME